jgi:heat shock protein HslJ
MRRIHSLFAAMTVGLLVAAIAPVASAQSPAADPLADTAWLLGEVAGTPVPSGTGASLVFGEDNAGGDAGCNRFMASYTTDGVSTLAFGPVATTMMLCDEATNTFEQGYLAALASVASFAIADSGLTLSDASGTAVLSYSASAPASVEGPWIVTNVNNGNQGVEPVPDGISATVSFHPDGTVEGFGGCNGFGGGYSIDGETIAIGPLMGTMMFCDDATNTFEAQLMAALQNATTWSVTNGVLDLRDDSGAQQVEANTAIGN